jgi:urease accessory protein
MRSKFILLSAALALLASGPAYAHTGVGTVFSFSSGFGHPLGGLDHLLAMFAVGLLAAQLGGSAIWLVPGAFVASMIVGAWIALAGVGLPGVELGITASILAIALPVAFALGMPGGLAMAYVGFFALFHGYAHGVELPVEAGAAPYMIGFALATATIHASGIATGIAMTRVGAAPKGSPALRLAGAMTAIAGIGLAMG